MPNKKLQKNNSETKTEQNISTPINPQPETPVISYNYDYSVISPKDGIYYGSKEIKVKKIIRKLS